MGQGSIVTTPDGAQWRVRRRWLDRPMPDLRRRLESHRKEIPGESLLEGAANANINFGDAFQGDSPVAVIAAIVLLLIAVFVLLPLLGVALELIALIFLLGSGLIGRVLLGRPWIVEATNVDNPEERVAYAVKGWRRSTEALRELRTALATTGPSAVSRGLRRGA